MTLRRRILIPGIAVGLTLAGCGSASKPLSTASFQADANSICAKYSVQIKALGQPSQTSLPEVSDWLNNAANLGQKETDDLKGLKPPSADNTRLASALQAQEGQVTKIRQLASSVKSGSLSSAQNQLQQLQSSDGPINSQFNALGLTTCGSGS